ncbi:MAG: response regulator transcription factor [Bacteroidaceae bacterium]|nr:response regulator transcription factor [Bacteroidaceae bacterium]
MVETKKRILLCEDDESLGMLLTEYLQAKGYDAELQPDGEEGFRAFVKNKYDLCVLDVMMPKKDGFTLAKEIREINQETPIIFLTAKNLKEDIVDGFKLGADDYIVKPFSMEELVLRMEAVLRRSVANRPKERSMYKLGKYTFDVHHQLLTFENEEPVKLTTKECELLALLAAHAGDVLQRELALKTIWIDDNYFNARSMDVYITKLRKRLQDDPDIEINNVHGKGYRIVCPNLNEEIEAPEQN